MTTIHHDFVRERLEKGEILLLLIFNQAFLKTSFGVSRIKDGIEQFTENLRFHAQSLDQLALCLRLDEEAVEEEAEGSYDFCWQNRYLYFELKGEVVEIDEDWAKIDDGFASGISGNVKLTGFPIVHTPKNIFKNLR